MMQLLNVVYKDTPLPVELKFSFLKSL